MLQDFISPVDSYCKCNFIYVQHATTYT